MNLYNVIDQKIKSVIIILTIDFTISHNEDAYFEIQKIKKCDYIIFYY